jgi:hypothetical protein
MNVPVAGPGVSAAAAPAVVIVFGIIVSVQPWNLKQFHLKLWRAGYKFQPSPRGVCMRGCHQGTPDLPHTSDFPATRWPRDVPGEST